MEGACLCGAITVTAPESRLLEICHCRMCRRWGGGPFLSVHSLPNVEIKGREQLQIYQSSAWAERAFCRMRGTHIYYRLLSTGYYDLPVGLFDSDIEFQVQEQIFVDRKPDYYDFANQTAMLTEAELLDLLQG